MAEKTIKATYKNPCKYCISRPVCQLKCEDLENHNQTIYISCFCIIGLFSMFSWWFLYFYLWFIYGFKSLIPMSIILIIGHIYSVKEAIQDHNWDKNKLWQKTLYHITGPYGFTISWLFDVCKVEHLIDNLTLYRYKKRKDYFI